MIKMTDNIIEKKLLNQNLLLQKRLNNLKKSRENQKYVQLLLKLIEQNKINLDNVNPKKSEEN